MTATADRDFSAQLTGYSLTTAEILYRMPGSSLTSTELRLAGIRYPPALAEAQAFPRILVSQSRGQTLSRHRVPQAAHHAGRAAVGR